MPFETTRRMFVLGGAAGLASAAMIGSAAAAAVGGSQPEGYRLGTGDRVRVIVFGEDQLTGEFEVSGAGLISLPLIGNISAQGLTTVELQKVITTALSDGYLQDPRVSIEVLTYRPFYILGEVNKPGEYPYTDNLTVLNAVATANGFTYRAATRRVYIKHKNEPNEKLYPLTSSTIILPGDTIRIGERYF